MSFQSYSNKLLFLILFFSVFILSFVSAGELKVTQEHPFLINGTWIDASELKVGDELTLANGSKVTITKLTDVVENESFPVYNLEAGEYHNFVVCGDDECDEDSVGVVVHNSNSLLVGEASISENRIIIKRSNSLFSHFQYAVYKHIYGIHRLGKIKTIIDDVIVIERTPAANVFNIHVMPVKMPKEHDSRMKILDKISDDFVQYVKANPDCVFIGETPVGGLANQFKVGRTARVSLEDSRFNIDYRVSPLDSAVVKYSHKFASFFEPAFKEKLTNMYNIRIVGPNYHHISGIRGVSFRGTSIYKYLNEIGVVALPFELVYFHMLFWRNVNDKSQDCLIYEKTYSIAHSCVTPEDCRLISRSVINNTCSEAVGFDMNVVSNNDILSYSCSFKERCLFRFA